LGKSNWVVVYGDNGQSWLLKAQLISGYIEYLLSQVKKSSIDIVHCKTYHEINIRQHEFGQENSWRRCPSRQGMPTQIEKRITFVYTCDTKKEQLGKQGATEAVRFFFLSMKKHQSNLVGPLVLFTFERTCRGSLYLPHER
jgi:hypothetical protein